MSEPTEQKKAPRTRGLVCTKCGCGHFYVVYTRHVEGRAVVRRRECRYCGHRITTSERAIGR